MYKHGFKNLVALLAFIIPTAFTCGQGNDIRKLEFLIGTWETREDNKERTWWEKSIRTIQYALDSTTIELRAEAISSTGKKRKYAWSIHYNSKLKQFEMVSIFSNWHEILFDILEWDEKNRKLSIKHDPDRNPGDYSERFGEMIFTESLDSYTWTGENKYGNPEEPSVWTYVETGTRQNRN